MFKKLHLRLTLLCAGITTAIMVIMSFCYLYVSEQGLYKNQFQSFKNDINTITASLESQSVITMEWLSKMEAKGNYRLFVLDNGIPFLYNRLSENLKKSSWEMLLQEAQTACDDYISVSSPAPAASFYVSYHFEYAFTSDVTHTDYFGSTIHTGKPNAELEIVVLSPLTSLKAQIRNQRLRFLFIDIAAIFALTLFSFLFTGRLLKPVIENQQKQIQFIAAVSHELRTPLAVISSAAECCQTAPSDARDIFFKTIRQESQHMASLIQDMLTLSQSDSKVFPLRIQPVELDTLLINSFEAFAPLAKEKEITLTLNLPSEALPACNTDSERLSQVIAVLLHNAISYTPEHGQISLSLSSKKPTEKFSSGKSRFFISVQDNGIGISREDKARIFDRFYRAEKSRSAKGHFGLGLSIAYEFVTMLGGTISVTDAEGGGSVFTVAL